jgi:hypothetical protein
MINNSNFSKWNRLRQKDLDHQFLNEIITGLSCSPFEARAVLEAVHSVFGHYFQTNGSLKPGQILFQAVSTENGPQIPLSRCQLVTVPLTLDAGQEDLLLKKQHGGIALRKHKLERVCHEAFQQNGLLTVEDLANRLLNCGERTISRDLASFREQETFIPLRSTVKDMGRTLSHRMQIVNKWLLGKEYTEIARENYHSISAVHNYVDKFKRVISLKLNGFEINTISFLAKVSMPLAAEYINIYQKAEMVMHRKTEIETFLKKTSTQTSERRCQ